MQYLQKSVENNRSKGSRDSKLNCGPNFPDSSRRTSKREHHSLLHRSPSFSNTQFSNTQSSIDILPQPQQHHELFIPCSSSSSSSTTKLTRREHYHQHLAALLAMLICGTVLFCAVYDQNEGWQNEHCVPSWIEPSRLQHHCIDPNSVCHTPQGSAVGQCVPLRSLGEGESCWTSADQCQEGLHCQLKLPSWERTLAPYNKGIHKNSINSLFQEYGPYQCWLWQLHDAALIIQQANPRQEIWMEAECGARISDVEWHQDNYGKILTPLSREQIGYCSTLNVPYKGEKDPVNQYVWCFPWDIIDPNTSQCYKREDMSCKVDSDCTEQVNRRGFTTSETVVCNSTTGRCQKETEPRCMDEFVDFQREMESLKSKVKEGSLDVLHLDKYTTHSRDFGCCMTEEIVRIGDQLAYGDEQKARRNREAAHYPDFCPEYPGIFGVSEDEPAEESTTELEPREEEESGGDQRRTLQGEQHKSTSSLLW